MATKRKTPRPAPKSTEPAKPAPADKPTRELTEDDLEHVTGGWGGGVGDTARSIKL
jgi:bacteriocin-like protein